MNHKEIRDRQNRLSIERREMQRKLMQDYDETVYLPARRANMAACEKLGHKLRLFIPNGLGRVFQICEWCDATIFEDEN